MQSPNDSEKSAPPSKRGTWLPIIAAVVVIAGLLVASRFFPIREWLRIFLEWVEELGAWGYGAFGLAYILACVFFIPGTILTLGAGFLFGTIRGTILVSISSVAGATVAFLLGRYLLRGSIQKKIAGRKKFEAIDRAVGRRGLKIVLLTRLVPLFPFNLQNYAYGLTDVRVRDYVLGSWVGMLPATIVYVYFGSTMQSLAEVFAGKQESSPLKIALLVAGLVALLLLIAYMTGIARKALREETELELENGAGENSK
ncbi:MAG: TVP38/TMEM64 family protein [Candidatus Sumerlaeota bacterium]